MLAVQRFDEARQVVHGQAARFGYPPDGPFARAASLAPSGDWMQGPFSEAVRATVRSMLSYLGHLSEEWDGVARALNRAAREAEDSARMQAVGLTPPATDPAAHLHPYRSWEPSPWRLDPGWAQPQGRGPGSVALAPELARTLGDHLREASEDLEKERRTFGQTMETFGIRAPYALTSLADAAWEIADEIERRVSAYERAEEEIARSARALVQSLMAPFAGLVGGAARTGVPSPPTPIIGASPRRTALFVTSPARLKEATNFRVGDRFDVLDGFFGKYGGEKDGLGYGEALKTFMRWERKSGRLDRRNGHDWWKGVNGSMMLDLSEAQRLLRKNPKARSENPAVRAWIDFATSKKDRQKKLWTAHQVSLHSAIRAADQAGLYDQLPPNEQRFVEQVVENVDLTALANMSSGSIGKHDLSGAIAAVGMDEYLDRVYPDRSVATEADLERVEDWATPGLLMDPRATKYLQTGGVIGMESNKW